MTYALSRPIVLLRAAIIGLLLAATGVATGPALAQREMISGEEAILRIASPTQLPISRRVVLGLHKAMIIELPVDAQDAIISQPNTIDATVLTARRVLIYAKSAGEANVFLLGRDGRKLVMLDVTVKRDLTDLATIMHRNLPGSRIKVEASGEGVILSGTVARPADASRAEELALQHLGKVPVVNLISTSAKEQVLLKVTVAELQREAIRRLGVNIPDAVAKAGSVTFAKVMQNSFPISSVGVAPGLFLAPGVSPAIGSGSVLQGTAAWNGNSITGMLESFERVGLARTLAEPTLIAISGEAAKFHAGGEFPIPVNQANNTISVAWKQFGVSVAFTPFVLDQGRISLKVAAEVSELSSQGAVTLQTIAIPAVQVRRAETVVEMPSGSALAMAGLLSEQTRRNVDGVPELKNLPILGALFRSQDYKSAQSELVILVTPYVVRPTETAQLSRPDDGLVAPSTLRGLVLGHLHRVYGNIPRHALKGEYGFIVDHPDFGETE